MQSSVYNKADIIVIVGYDDDGEGNETDNKTAN